MRITTGLTILFVGLKLVGTIHWSWLCVMAPTLADICLYIGVHVAAEVSPTFRYMMLYFTRGPWQL